MLGFNCYKWSINKKMLPMKLHYFFYSTALGTVFLFLPLIAKNIGISATGFGFIFTITPFINVFINPILGCITDKFQKIKHIIIFVSVLHTPIYFSINFIPEMITEKQFFSNVSFYCGDNFSHFIASTKFLKLEPNNKSFECQTECSACQNNELINNASFCNQIFTLITEPFINKTENLLIINITSKSNFTLCSQEMDVTCDTKCFLDKNEKINSFNHYQFWLFVILTSVAIIITDAIIALSDTACHEALEGRVNQFGKQRVWLSIGWGIISMATGYIIELVNVNNKGKTDFSICFYLMLSLMVVDIIVLNFTEMRKEKSSNNILNDVRKIFIKPHPFFLGTAVFLVGALSGLQWNYAFWYFEELGASKILMGVSTAVFCMFAEVPFMFISGWIIKKIGRDNSMCLAFIALSIWFLSASFIYDPWWIILSDLTQGPSYGLFYVAMSTYGKIVAPPGTEASMQTILRAVFSGLGVGTGSLLGGVCFDIFGGRLTFRFAGFIALISAAVYKFITIFIAGEDSIANKNKEENEEKKTEDK